MLGATGDLPLGAQGRGREGPLQERHLKGKVCSTRASGDGIAASRAARVTQDPHSGETCSLGVKRSGLPGE